MNPLQQQELIDKLNRQNQQAGFDTSLSTTPPAQATMPIVENVGVSVPSQTVQPESDLQAEPEIYPAHPVYSDVAIPLASENENVTDEIAEKAFEERQLSRSERIEALERELEEAPKISNNVTVKAKAYLDDFGAETYYVKNISNGHVSVSDIDVTVKRGESEDLLKFADIEDIKKSRDLRTAIGYERKPNPYRRTLLLRLTPEEYEEEKTKQLRNKRKIDQFKQSQAVAHANFQQNQQQTTQTYNGVTQQIIAQPQTPRIRPTVLSKLEKLRLSTVPENAHLGMGPEEFVGWAVTEDLSIEELDFIISHPNVINNHHIRTALYEKRSEIV